MDDINGNIMLHINIYPISSNIFHQALSFLDVHGRPPFLRSDAPLPDLRLACRERQTLRFHACGDQQVPASKKSTWVNNIRLLISFNMGIYIYMGYIVLYIYICIYVCMYIYIYVIWAGPAILVFRKPMNKGHWASGTELFSPRRLNSNWKFFATISALPAPLMGRRFESIFWVFFWLVVGPPLWKIWARHLGWWYSQYMGK